MTPQCTRVVDAVQCPHPAAGAVAVAFYPFASMTKWRCRVCGGSHMRDDLAWRASRPGVAVALECPDCHDGQVDPVPLRRLVLGVPLCEQHQLDAKLEELMIPSSVATMIRFIERETTLSVDPKGVKVLPCPFDDPDYRRLEAARLALQQQALSAAIVGGAMDDNANPLAGLKPGRIVYYVFNAVSAVEVNQRRTVAASVGNPVTDGDICPAMVVRVLGETGTINLKVMLDGSDEYWARSVPFGAGEPGTWHWMFTAQNTRYQPDRVEASTVGTKEGRA